MKFRAKGKRGRPKGKKVASLPRRALADLSLADALAAVGQDVARWAAAAAILGVPEEARAEVGRVAEARMAALFRIAKGQAPQVEDPAERIAEIEALRQPDIASASPEERAAMIIRLRERVVVDRVGQIYQGASGRWALRRGELVSAMELATLAGITFSGIHWAATRGWLAPICPEWARGLWVENAQARLFLARDRSEDRPGDQTAEVDR